MDNSPPPPTPTDVSAQSSALGSLQEGANIKAAGETAALGSGAQSNWLGQVTHPVTGYTPQGNPIYGTSVTLNPDQQQLYNLLTGTQTTAGTQAGNLLTGANYGGASPTSVIGNATTGTTNDLMKMYMAANQPYQDVQLTQFIDRLKNTGVDYGSDPTAFMNAVAPVVKGQQTANLQALAQFEPAAFTQAQTLYEEPWKISSAEALFGSPTSPLTAAPGTPTATMQPANYIGAYGTVGTTDASLWNLQNQYTAQQNAWLNPAASVVGGLARNPQVFSGMGGILSSLAPVAAV